MYDGLEVLFGICVLVTLVAILAAVTVGPVVGFMALKRTRDLERIKHRLERVEERLRAGSAAPLSEPASLRLEDLPEVRPASEPVPQPQHRPRRVAAAISDRMAGGDAVHLESFIGRRVLAWVAASLLVLAASFFLNYAFQSKMIGPAGQVSVAATVGAALSVWGFQRFSRGGWVICQVLTGTGVFVLFLAVYAAFSVYPLLTPAATSLYLTVLMAEAGALAVLYRSQTLAFLAAAGGLLTPLLIRQEGDPYRSYFVYLAVLNLIAQGIYWARPWVGLRSLALLGTQGLFWLWFIDRYHPDKMAAVLVFQALVAAAYLVPDWLAARRCVSQPEDWALQIAVPWLLFLAVRRVLAEYHPAWMGTLSLAMATAWTLMVIAASRPAFVSDPNRTLVLMGTALAFLGLSFPLQAKSYWAAVGWSAEGAVLWWLGLRVRAWSLRTAGVVFLVLACFGALYVMSEHAPEKPYLPVVNRRTLTVLAVAAGLLTAAWTSRIFRDRLELPDAVVRYAAGLIAVGLVWLVVSWETWDGAELLLSFRDELVMHTALSFAWALYAGLLLAVGFRLDHAPTRWTALGLFSVTLLKLLFYDLSELPGIFRVLTFLMAAVVLAAAAGAYRWYQLTRPREAAEASND